MLPIDQGFSVHAAGKGNPVILGDPKEWTLAKPGLVSGQPYPENTYA